MSAPQIGHVGLPAGGHWVCRWLLYLATLYLYYSVLVVPPSSSKMDHWRPYLPPVPEESMHSRVSCVGVLVCREPTNGAEVVAARLEQVGRRQFVPPAFNPLARMKDTVVFGYLMASSKHGRVDVPDW